jgi:predicted PurR-regulated permease PerM
MASMMSDQDVQSGVPTWLRRLGFSSWLLVGFVLIIVGVIWLLGQTSTIVMPVILAAVLGAVAGPAVGWLEGHRIPRVAGAILILLALVAIGALIFYLVFAGISAQSSEISAKLNQAVEKLQAWFADLGADQTQQAKASVRSPRPRSRTRCWAGSQPASRGCHRCCSSSGLPR